MINKHITTQANTITTDVVYVIWHKLHIVGKWTSYLGGYIVSYLNNGIPLQVENKNFRNVTP